MPNMESNHSHAVQSLYKHFHVLFEKPTQPKRTLKFEVWQYVYEILTLMDKPLFDEFAEEDLPSETSTQSFSILDHVAEAFDLRSYSLIKVLSEKIVYWNPGSKFDVSVFEMIKNSFPLRFNNLIWNKSDISRLSPFALKQTLCFPESFAVNII